MTFDAKPKTKFSIPHVIQEIALSVLVAVVVFGAIQWWQERDFSGGLAEGAAALPLDLVDVQSGERVTLDTLKGGPVLLNFWATWCGPCRSEMPALQRLSERAPGGLRVISITADEKTLVTRFLANGGYTFPCLIDAAGDVSDRYRVATLPRSVLLDAQSKVVWDHIGALDLSKVSDAIEAL